MKNQWKTPIKILGAGISGLSAAIILSKNDIEVEIYEKEKRIGGRFTRNFQGLQNYGNISKNPIKEFKEMGLTIEPYKNIYRAIRFSPSLYNFEVVSENEPIAYMVIRGTDSNSLDSQLTSLAIKLGVKINYNSKVNKKDVNIVATGPQKASFIAYGFHFFDVVMDDAAYGFLDNRYSPNKYLYLAPGEKKGEAAIVTLCETNTGITTDELKKLLYKALNEIPILKEMVADATLAREYKHFGFVDVPDSAFIDGKYYIGEAAGFQDATAFYGIGYAIKSGFLAAQSIITGKDYDFLWRETLKSSIDFDVQRSKRYKEMTNDNLDNMFRFIIDNYGNKLDLKTYENLRHEM